MGFFGKKRNNKSNSTPGIDIGNNNNEAVMQGRMQDLQADMQRVKQRHEAELQMLNRRMVSIVAKANATPPPSSSSKAVPPPPPPPPGPPPGGRPPSRRRSRGSGINRDPSIHSSNMSQRSADQSHLRRRRSRQEQHHTRHIYQLPQPIQSAPPVSEISIVAESVGSTASATSRNNYYGDDNSSHDTSHASHTSYSYKNGRKVRTVYRTVRAIDDGDGAVPATPTTAPEREIRVYRSPGHSRQSASLSSSYDRNGIVVRNHPPPENSPIRSNVKALRGRAHATDSSASYDGGSSIPISSSERRNNRGRGDYHTSRMHNDMAAKEKWTPAHPTTEKNAMSSERNNSRRNYHDYSIPQRDATSHSSLSDSIRHSRQNDVRRQARLAVDVRNAEAYNPRVANTNQPGVYEATSHLQNRNTRPNRNQVSPRPAPAAPAISGGPPIDLMESIRAGVQLKSVSDGMSSDLPRAPQESPVNVLMAAIQERKRNILAQEEEDEVDW